MLEKVLKRLCPCYFHRSEDSRPSGCQTSTDKQTYSNSYERTNSSSPNETTVTSSTGGGSGDSGDCAVTDNWKGTLNIIHPQPVYAFPMDTKKSIHGNEKNLLKPPLYWRKTMKNLCSEGPPVFQKGKRKKLNKDKRKKPRPLLLKHSGTVADLTSITSGRTADVRWLKSKSLSSLTSNKENTNLCINDCLVSNQSDITGVHTFNYDNFRRDRNCLKCKVFPDISHGIILFTATYLSQKKMCLLNINRLENLSKKGREGNPYYTIIKLAVLPCEKYIKSTKILNKCSNPDVMQDFSFSLKELSGKVLRLSVFDASVQKQHEAVGHALLSLEDIKYDQPKKYRLKLYRRTQPHICPGNLAVSLKYISEADKFTIIVEKGRNLNLQEDKNVKLNTYVKVTLYVYGEKVKTKKSVIVFNCIDPNYSSTFTFNVRKDQIDHLSIAIVVRQKGFVNDITIGRLNFGPFFYVANRKLTPWGRVFLKKETVFYWFRMYL